MQNLAVKQNYTLEEYAELEMASEERLEYFEGNVWSMAGASDTHEDIVSNIITELKTRLRGRGCKVYSSNLRVKVPIYPPYRYPDVTAVCGERIFENFLGLRVLINPALIVEVLSPSTATFDVGDKFTYYKSIESFTEYLLIDQDKPHVVLYTKQTADAWLQREFNDLNDKLYLSSLDCEISVAEIYLDVEFPEIIRPRFPFDREDFC
ncbi:MAG: Uma2 family endonuclease [Acidobacteriota bacterium]|nr:Uma2 family endonuclease [Acidobacteriota bacterium]